jgi:mycofactocin precursor
MNIESAVAAPQDQVIDSALIAPEATDGVEELLVEEVSIDGMCGVY